MISLVFLRLSSDPADPFTLGNVIVAESQLLVDSLPDEAVV